MKLLKRLEAILNFFVDTLAVFGASLIILVMVFVTIDVVMRYFFNRPIFWVGELAEYALLFITFTGTAWVLKKNKHVKVDILGTLVNENIIRLLDILTGFLGGLICLVLTYFGVIVAWDHFQRGVYNPTLLSFPKGILLAVIPVGTFLLAFEFLRRIILLVRRQEEV